MKIFAFIFSIAVLLLGNGFLVFCLYNKEKCSDVIQKLEIMGSTVEGSILFLLTYVSIALMVILVYLNLIEFKKKY